MSTDVRAHTRAECEDFLGWEDWSGDGCFKYGYDVFPYCNISGHMVWPARYGPLENYHKNGVDGVHACCACGGGSSFLGKARLRRRSPTRDPSDTQLSVYVRPSRDTHARLDDGSTVAWLEQPDGEIVHSASFSPGVGFCRPLQALSIERS